MLGSRSESRIAIAQGAFERPSASLRMLPNVGPTFLQRDRDSQVCGAAGSGTPRKERGLPDGRRRHFAGGVRGGPDGRTGALCSSALVSSVPAARRCGGRGWILSKWDDFEAAASGLDEVESP